MKTQQKSVPDSAESALPEAEGFGEAVSLSARAVGRAFSS